MDIVSIVFGLGDSVHPKQNYNRVCRTLDRSFSFLLFYISLCYFIC